jgi:transposase
VLASGSVLSATLIATLPELRTLSRWQVAAHGRRSAINQDSASFEAGRRVWGGRSQIRPALYMAALVASRYNPMIRAFSQRLGQAGKPGKVVLNCLYEKASSYPQRPGQRRRSLAIRS